MEKLRIELVKSPIFAGMEFGTKNNKIKKIGYDLIELVWTSEVQLISEKRIKRVIL